MSKESFDPGLGQKFSRKTKRMINKDGSFNVRRIGHKFTTHNAYQNLINLSWWKFNLLVLLSYVVVNGIFAFVYACYGPNYFSGMKPGSFGEVFMECFYFSTHTFTSVGYGNVSPNGHVVNVLASFEALVGLMSFALGTGLIYGRFSKPKARLHFSEFAIIRDDAGTKSFQLTIANARKNTLIEMTAHLMYVTIDPRTMHRNYNRLKLAVPYIYFMPLNWTIVHEIDEESPLYGKTALDLKNEQGEFLISISGFDDNFSQTVHTRYSYQYDEVRWNKKFARPYETKEDGDIILRLNELDKLEE